MDKQLRLTLSSFFWTAILLAGCNVSINGSELAKFQGPPTGDQDADAPQDEVSVPPVVEKFWTWQEPLGEAANRRNILQIVRHGANLSPATAADRSCNEVLARGLQSGEVCITIQNFGTVDTPYPIFKHPSDRIQGHDTIWMSHGIASAKEWFDGFVARYLERQGFDDAIPSPSRFQFDAELTVVPHRFDQTVVFDLMKSDPRWDSEPIPGFDGKTLAVLYQEAGEPTCDPMGTWNSPINRNWTKWFAMICDTASDAAMNEVAYRNIAATWPECKYGNFSTSIQYDGLGDPPRLNFHDNALWYQWTVRASGTTLSPVFYWMETSKVEVHLEYMLGSSTALMTPWILAVGHFDPDHGGHYTQEMFRDQMRLLRERGVSEFLLFGNSQSGSEEFWRQMIEVIDSLP